MTEKIIFDGQQTDERILAVIMPHRIRMILSVAGLFSATVLSGAVLIGILSLLRLHFGLFHLMIILGAGIIFVMGAWWIRLRHSRSVTYVTDRRIIRFEPTTPFFNVKRSLFWNEVLKTKGHAPNLMLRMLKIGTVVVEPHLSESDNVIVSDVYLYEDIVNYIDKILYTTKNKPGDVASLKLFVPKPKGMRG